MLRRTLTAILFSLLLMPVLPVAADEVDDLVGVLRGQGYDKVEVEQTLLGRTRIEARNARGTREIIINARTGEVLRDVWVDRKGRSLPPELADHYEDSGHDDGGDHGDDHGGNGSGGSDD